MRQVLATHRAGRRAIHVKTGTLNRDVFFTNFSFDNRWQLVEFGPPLSRCRARLLPSVGRSPKVSRSVHPERALVSTIRKCAGLPDG